MNVILEFIMRVVLKNHSLTKEINADTDLEEFQDLIQLNLSPLWADLFSGLDSANQTSLLNNLKRRKL